MYKESLTVAVSMECKHYDVDVVWCVSNLDLAQGTITLFPQCRGLVGIKNLRTNEWDKVYPKAIIKKI